MKQFFIALFICYKFTFALDLNTDNKRISMLTPRRSNSSITIKNLDLESSDSISNKDENDLPSTNRKYIQNNEIDFAEHSSNVIKALEFLFKDQNGRQLIIKIFDDTEKIIKNKSQNWDQLFKHLNNHYWLLEYKTKFLKSIYDCLSSEDIYFCLEQFAKKTSFCYSDININQEDFLLFINNFSNIATKDIYKPLEIDRFKLRKSFLIIFEFFIYKMQEKIDYWQKKKLSLKDKIEFNKYGFIIKVKKILKPLRVEEILFTQINSIEKDEEKKKIKIKLESFSQKGEQKYFVQKFKTLNQMDSFFHIYEAGKRAYENNHNISLLVPETKNK